MKKKKLVNRTKNLTTTAIAVAALIPLFAMAFAFAQLSLSGNYKQNASKGENTSATYDGVNDFNACNEDGQNVCSGFFGDDWETWASKNGYKTGSWKIGFTDCIKENLDKVSEECAKSVNRRILLNETLNTACKEDRSELCKGVEPVPGIDPQVDCLMANIDALSSECREAVENHEAAKAVK